MKTHATALLLSFGLGLFCLTKVAAQTEFPAGKTFLIRGFPFEFNADKSFRTYGGSLVYASGIYEVNGKTIAVTDTGGLYMSKDKNGQRITGKYRWKYEDGSLTFTLIEDKADARRTAMLEAPFVPGDRHKEIIDLELALAEAYNKGDPALFNKTLTDDFWLTNDTYGLAKSRLIRSLPVEPTGARLQIEGLRVYITGTTGVAIGNQVVTRKVDDREIKQGEKFTDTFAWQDGQWRLMASHTSSLPYWQFRELDDSELKPISPLACQELSAQKSLASSTPAYIRFKNQTKEPIVVSWVNFEGKPEKANQQTFTIAPNESMFRYTYLTHPFLVADSRGNCLGIYQPEQEPSLAVIK